MSFQILKNNIRVEINFNRFYICHNDINCHCYYDDGKLVEEYNLNHIFEIPNSLGLVSSMNPLWREYFNQLKPNDEILYGGYTDGYHEYTDTDLVTSHPDSEFQRIDFHSYLIEVTKVTQILDDELYLELPKDENVRFYGGESDDDDVDIAYNEYCKTLTLW
jgi:hypothetical protein